MYTVTVWETVAAPVEVARILMVLVNVLCVQNAPNLGLHIFWVPSNTPANCEVDWNYSS